MNHFDQWEKSIIGHRPMRMEKTGSCNNKQAAPVSGWPVNNNNQSALYSIQSAASLASQGSTIKPSLRANKERDGFPLIMMSANEIG